MATGPVGPQDPTGSGDPTMPAHPGAVPGAGAPPVYSPAPDQRFERGQTGAPGAYPPGYGPAHPGAGHQGPSMQDRAAEAADAARRAVRTPETKEFFKSSEFLVWGLTFLMLLIAGAASEVFDGPRMWLYVTIISGAYIISRGLAKAGTSRGRPESHWGHDH